VTLDAFHVGDDMDSEEELELADLESETPVQQVKVEAELDAVSRSVRADVDTAGFDQVLEKRLAGMGKYGFMALLEAFGQRMVVPLYGPYTALHEHLSNMDADAREIRKHLCQLLDEYPREVKLFVVAQEANALLLEYSKIREVFMVRRDIAEFRELALGVNGTVAFIANLRRAKPVTEATPDDVAKILKLASNLSTCLHQFRLEYDVFDDAYFTVTELEKAIDDAREWSTAAEKCARERAI
jgi:hypothetical protein